MLFYKGYLVQIGGYTVRITEINRINSLILSGRTSRTSLLLTLGN